MQQTRARYLIDRLITNRMSEQELNELLGALGEEQMTDEISEALEAYFLKLVENQKNAFGEKSDKILNHKP
ncbi:hypothetical protein [Arundinibacter roseus]|uniref:Uncharacterized protein n=1 Tax=Arundinibacter roseus TaxID=2070510 RepID=A0A4R4K341_9BACT|nr:hypothetical protein [Arundinibacter roseus]TDB61767.1 hypothetical protein EZE20_18640 [Arundinibacter roseus]